MAIIDRLCQLYGGGGHVTNCNCSKKEEIMADHTGGILLEIQQERERQEQLKRAGKFLFTPADEVMTNPERLAILAEEFGETAKEVTEEIILETKARKQHLHPKDSEVWNIPRVALLRKMRTELIQVAAVCVAWVEGLDKELRGEP